jgi:photosystem II stability/assembly factor-like uncharacterized protein
MNMLGARAMGGMAWILTYLACLGIMPAMRALAVPLFLTFLNLGAPPPLLPAPAPPDALAGADAPSWRPIGPDGPAVIESLAFDPQRPRIAFASMYAGGIARSEDAGLTWHTSNVGLTDPYITGLIVHPRLSRLVYALNAGGQLVRSLDGGRSWSELLALGNRLTSFAPAPADPAVVYAGTYVGLFVSHDSGDTWRRVEGGGLPPFYRVAVVAVDAKDSRLLYAGIVDYRGFGLWVSRDSGLTWLRRLRTVPEQLVCDPLRSGTVYLLKFGILQRSRDQGATWEAYYSAAGGSGGPALGLAFDTRNPWIAYVPSDGERAALNRASVYKTIDDGAHWQALTVGLPANAFTSALAANPAGTLLFGTGFGGGLYRSTDSGASWSPAGSGLVNTSVLTLAFGAPGTLFASTGPGVSRSRDGGVTWTQVLHVPVAVTALAVDRSNPETLYVGTWLNSGIAPPVAWKSMDGGDTWAALPYPQPAANPYAGLAVTDLAVDPTDSQVVYLAAQEALVGAPDGGGVYRSPDGGQTWIKTALPSRDFYSVAVSPTQPETVWAVWIDGAYKSADHGQSWTQMLAAPQGIYLSAVATAPSDPNVVWVIGQNVTYRSSDGGATWRQLSGLIRQPYFAFYSYGHPLAVDPADPDTVYVAWMGGVSRRTLGTGWQDFDAGLLNRDALTIGFDPADPGRLLVGTGGAGAFELRLTP